MKHGSLFSGIGGFDLAAQWMGWDNVFHCEINPFCQKILKYYWPTAESLDNIKTTDFTKYEGQINIISGGFPCQPYSLAGQRKGTEDDRHLWPEMLRAIREIKPRWVVGENVYGLVNWSGGLVFEEIHADLEAQGYEVWATILPAVSKDAPHRRDRVWFVAYSASNGLHDKSTETDNSIRKNNQQSREQRKRTPKEFSDESVTANANKCERCKGGQYESQSKATKRHISKCNARSITIPNWQNFPSQSPICSRNDGIPDRLDGITFSKWRNESIKGYGNAVVPQVVYEIFKVIDVMELDFLQDLHFSQHKSENLNDLLNKFFE